MKLKLDIRILTFIYYKKSSYTTFRINFMILVTIKLDVTNLYKIFYFIFLFVNFIVFKDTIIFDICPKFLIISFSYFFNNFIENFNLF